MQDSLERAYFDEGVVYTLDKSSTEFWEGVHVSNAELCGMMINRGVINGVSLQDIEDEEGSYYMFYEGEEPSFWFDTTFGV